MASRGLSLSVKIFLGSSAVVVVALAATLAIAARSANSAADASVQRVAFSAREAVTAQLAGRAEAMVRSAEVFAGNASFRAVIVARDSNTYLDQANVAVDETGSDWSQIVDAEGLRLTKSDEPDAPKESLANSPAIGGALEGDAVTAFGISDDTLLSQIAVVPIADRAVYGALMIARYLRDDFAEEVKRAAFDQLDVVFYALDSEDQPHVNGATLERAILTSDVLRQLHAAASLEESGGSVDITVGDRTYVALGGLLRSAGGTPLGGFALLKDRDTEFALFRALERTLLITGALALLAAFVFSLLVARWVTRPVAKLAEAARRASDGDYNASITANSRDEIGSLAAAFRRLLADLREKQELVNFLSAGAGDAQTVRLDRPASTTSGQQLGSKGLVPGQVFAGRYDVKELLGQGGMGTVFKAIDRQLGEAVAIKTLRQDFLQRDPAALDRFKSEIRLARRISHRNVVRTHDLGETDGLYFITMEYVEGTSLKDLIRSRGRLPVPVVLSVGKQLARALEVAHEQGIIHRDVKPHNIVVEPDGVLKVMDFGIARLAERPHESGVTQQGAIVGTPEYMAPEQVTGEQVDARVDLYAMGCVLFECLVGRPPLQAETPYQLVAKLLEETPIRVRSVNAEVPEALDVLVADLLAKDPARRPQGAVAVYERLAAIG